jgi:hypothetical protein
MENDRTFYRKSISLLALILVILLKQPVLFCQPVESQPVEDVFRVMELVVGNNDNPLWPGFNVSEIPVMVFDSINTWLFHSELAPDGFTEVKEHPGIYKFNGQHPIVWGNSVTRLGDKWIATSVFSSYARRTVEKYNARDLAGIIIHEQFHIFQRINHPRWQQNDGLLLLYPAETVEALFLRRVEKEAFKRAVLSNSTGEISGWVKEALSYRDQRLNMINPVFGHYEKELQRTEGLSDYIEKVARELDPLNASDITNGIAPAGVRDMGYVEGRWIAMILDKINPGWKLTLEENDTLYLEDILEKSINYLPGNTTRFSSDEINIIRVNADGDFLKWQERKNQEIEQFNDLPGYRVEINASANPLIIRIFEPLEIEILDDRSVYHRLIFSAGNEAGALRIMNQPCISWFDNSLRIEKLVLNGLKEPPAIIENENKLVIKSNNISIDLKYTRMSIDGLSYMLEL